MSLSLQPHRLWPAKLLCPWDSLGKNTGVGCHFLLQEFFPTQGLNPGLLHLQADCLPAELPGKQRRREVLNINTSFWTGLLTFCCLSTTIDAWVSCPGSQHFKGSKRKELAGVILTGLWVPELGNWDHTPHSHSQDTQICLKVIICTWGDILPSHCWNYEMGNFRSYFATLDSWNGSMVYPPYLE